MSILREAGYGLAGFGVYGHDLNFGYIQLTIGDCGTRGYKCFLSWDLRVLMGLIVFESKRLQIAGA